MPKKCTNTYKDREVYEITIPGLTDIIHIKPRYEFSEEEKEELKKPHKYRDYTKFTKEGLEELERRREIAKRIKKSPIPNWARKLQRVITWIDNVEDAISTATTALEVMTVAIPSIASITAPLIAAGELMSTVADLFNAAASLPTGPTGAKRAGGYLMDAVTGKFGGIFKPMKNIEKVHEIAKFAEKYGWKAALKELHSKREWIGKAIEAAQTSDNFFGIGLCLGPVMGLISDAFYGIVRKIQGKEVRIKVPWWAKDAKAKALKEHPEHAPFYKGSGEYDAPVKALKALDSASRLMSIPGLDDAEVLLRAAIAINISSQVVNAYLKGRDIDDYINLATQVDAEEKVVDRPDTRGILYDIGISPDEPVKDPASHNIECQKEVDYVVSAMKDSVENPKKAWEDYEEDEYKYTFNLLVRSHYMTIPHIVDKTGKTEWKRTVDPDRTFAEICLRMRVLPPENATLEQIENFINEGAAFYLANGRYPYEDEAREIAKRTMGGYRTEPPLVIPQRYAKLLGIAEQIETAKLPPLAL